MDATKRFGCRIVDAEDELKIHVKPEDIKGAVCRDHQKCAIARAIMRQKSSTAKWVDVGAAVVLVGTGAKRAKRYLLNGQAKEQVRYFDTHDGRFAPCVVELKCPTTGNRKLGERSGVKQGTPSSKRTKKAARRQQPTR